ncbi:hypothetical protein [Rubrivirga sp.]|uniref:hypothetical protein n=1 Tax=Rubrivirga sp. TaxID=1885344 RepID=UPI003C77B3DC
MAAIEAGDLDAVSDALDDRQRAIEALDDAGLGAPSTEATAQAREQAERLMKAFRDGLESLGNAIATVSDVARADGFYRQSSVERSVLDTAPR